MKKFILTSAVFATLAFGFFGTANAEDTPDSVHSSEVDAVIGKVGIGNGNRHDRDGRSLFDENRACALVRVTEFSELRQLYYERLYLVFAGPRIDYPRPASILNHQAYQVNGRWMYAADYWDNFDHVFSPEGKVVLPNGIRWEKLGGLNSDLSDVVHSFQVTGNQVTMANSGDYPNSTTCDFSSL